jgi:hypothetical protein
MLGAQLAAEQGDRRNFFWKVGMARLFGYKDSIHAS